MVDVHTRLDSLRGAPAGLVHPAELSAAIIREANLGCRSGPNGLSAPNRFSLRLNQTDLRAFPRPHVLNKVLEEAVEITARDRGWRLAGPARVKMEADPSLLPGSFSVSASERRGRRPSWAVLIRPGQEHSISVNRCLVGKTPPADLIISHKTVSPAHALIWQEHGIIWIKDVGSSHGTFLGGIQVTSKTEVSAPCQVAFGGLEYQLEEL